MANVFRLGNHNSRNIYRAGLDRDTDVHVAVAFDPEIATLIVRALNAAFSEGDHPFTRQPPTNDSNVISGNASRFVRWVRSVVSARRPTK
jgi:hypothetical protein